MLSNHNKILIVKLVFQAIILYGCPVWGNCAKTHLKRLQVSQNKILKMALNLPWHFSTNMLHTISNVNTVTFCIERIINRFQTNCMISENPLISNLYT